MNKQGVSFSIEFIIALILIVSLLTIIPTINETSFKNTIIYSQTKDLLTIWAKTKETNINEMITDAEFILGKRKIIINLNKKQKENNYKKTSETITNEIIYYNKQFKKIKVKIKVYS